MYVCRGFIYLECSHTLSIPNSRGGFLSVGGAMLYSWIVPSNLILVIYGVSLLWCAVLFPFHVANLYVIFPIFFDLLPIYCLLFSSIYIIIVHIPVFPNTFSSFLGLFSLPYPFPHFFIMSDIFGSRPSFPISRGDM